MKIVFTGGGSGGHFYPIIAVAQEIRILVQEKKLIEPDLYYFGPTPYDERALFELGITHYTTAAGKLRRYASMWNYIDMIKTFWGALTAILKLFVIYPDVVFTKGGYASFPTVFAARVLRIPIVVHESDSVFGKANAWATKFARSIAVSYPELAATLHGKPVAHTGNPTRREFFQSEVEGAYEYLHLEKDVPVVLILGGSQGAQVINDVVVDALPELLPQYQIIHQTGEKNLKEIETRVTVTLAGIPQASRYRPFAFLNVLALKMAMSAASLVVARAGSSGIFEIAASGLPSIIIPIPKEVSHDQSKNAFAYARAGAAVVVEQNNLTPHLLVAEIDRLFGNPELIKQMSAEAKAFARPDAARTIADELISIGIEHETH